MITGSVTHGNYENHKRILKENLECSDVYAQKIIEWAQDDDKGCMTYLSKRELNATHGKLSRY